MRDEKDKEDKLPKVKAREDYVPGEWGERKDVEWIMNGNDEFVWSSLYSRHDYWTTVED